MSNPNPLESPESIIQDFNYNIEDLNDFVIASKKRTLTDSQRKIIIKNKISAIKSSYNLVTRQIGIEPEARSQVLFDSIAKLTDVINSMNFTDIFELIWYEINALINSFASALISLHSRGDIWSIQGSAALLVQIILGLPKIDHLPDQLQGSIEDPEYLDRWKVTFNCLQFSAETYTSVIYAIKTVGISDFIYWVNQAYYYLSLMDRYFNIFEFEKIAQVLKNNSDYYFKMIYIMCSSFQNLVGHSQLLIKILGSKWPSDISTSDLFEDRSLGGYLNLIKHVKEINKIALDKINSLFKNGQWTMNDNPMQAGWIKAVVEINKIYDYNTSYIESLKMVEPEFHKLQTNANNETLINSLTSTISLNEWVQSFFEKQAGSHDDLLNSIFASNYIDILSEQFDIISLLVVCTDNIEPLENLLHRLDWLFSSEKIHQFTNLIVKKFLVELFIATKLSRKDTLERLYNELQTIQELLLNQHRDFSSFVLLEYILGFLLGKIGIPKKDAILIKINKNGLIVGGDYHLYNEFQEYVDYLSQVLNGENFDFSEQLLTRKSFFNITDSITWLIPDFNANFKAKLPIPLYYLPFNRYCDGLIYSNLEK